MVDPSETHRGSNDILWTEASPRGNDRGRPEVAQWGQRNILIGTECTTSCSWASLLSVCPPPDSEYRWGGHPQLRCFVSCVWRTQRWHWLFLFLHGTTLFFLCCVVLLILTWQGCVWSQSPGSITDSCLAFQYRTVGGPHLSRRPPQRHRAVPHLELVHFGCVVLFQTVDIRTRDPWHSALSSGWVSVQNLTRWREDSVACPKSLRSLPQFHLFLSLSFAFV